MSNKKAFSRLLDAVNKAKESTSFKDSSESTYYPEVDAAGSGFAVIRFLPAKNEEDVPFVKLYNHGFKNEAGRWFIENCPTTIGASACPVCEGNSVLWNSGLESDKKIARDRKRKVSYYSNILVVQDTKNPENEGKVFLFRYGKKIYDKIIDCIQPEFADDEPMNPFDLEDGANFKLKIRRVEGYANVDKSEFEKTSGVDLDWDSVKDSIFDLNQLIAPEKFKSYSELKSKYNSIVGHSDDMDDLPKSTKQSKSDEDDEDVPAPKAAPKKEAVKPAPKKDEDDDSDADLDYFRKLAEDD
jgi:hypothetical protein